MDDRTIGHGTARYEIYSLKSIALFAVHLMSLIAYRWPTMIYGTELGLWHGIILTVPSQQVSHNDTLYYAMLNAASMPDQSMRHETRIDPVRPQPPGLSTNLHALFLALRDRHSSNPIDKVCAIAFPFQKRGNGDFHITFPIYDPSTPCNRQLLPQTRFLESFLEYVHSFRYQALRPTFTGPVFLRGSSGVLG